MFKLYILHIYVMDEFSVYATGFAKRSLSNSMMLEDQTLIFKYHINLKFSPFIKLCWDSRLTKFQVIIVFQSEVIDCQS